MTCSDSATRVAACVAQKRRISAVFGLCSVCSDFRGVPPRRAAFNDNLNIPLHTLHTTQTLFFGRFPPFFLCSDFRADATRATHRRPSPVGTMAEYASAKLSRFRQHLRRSFGVAFGRPTT